MADWTSSMEQSFEYYIVDPGTWKDSQRIDGVISCSISRDLEAETLGSATIDVDGVTKEVYIRAYLVTVQNGVTERFPLATFLVQTPSMSFDGRKSTVSLDAYTPLIELKENQPPLGYFVPQDDNVMEAAYQITAEHARAPVVRATSDVTMFRDFVSNSDDTWMTFLSDLVANAKFYFDLDEMGRILFAPKQDTASMQPVWTYDDSNSSILYPDITVDRDLYGIPNVIEVIYSDEHDNYYARVVNDDENSPISTVNRGREIIQRVENPDLTGIPTQNMITEYAEQYLREVSTLEYTVSYTHGYCPVRIGDCVRLNYKKAGLTNIKARVISQTIKCEPGTPVSEKAVFTTKLWR